MDLLKKAWNFFTGSGNQEAAPPAADTAASATPAAATAAAPVRAAAAAAAPSRTPLSKAPLSKAPLVYYTSALPDLHLNDAGHPSLLQELAALMTPAQGTLPQLVEYEEGSPVAPGSALLFFTSGASAVRLPFDEVEQAMEPYSKLTCTKVMFVCQENTHGRSLANQLSLPQDLQRARASGLLHAQWNMDYHRRRGIIPPSDPQHVPRTKTSTEQCAAFLRKQLYTQ